MKVKIIKTGEVQTVADSYGVRLIEQGAAIVAPAPAATATKAEKKADTKNAGGK